MSKIRVILLLFIFVSGIGYAQEKLCYTDILNGSEIINENKISNYTEYNFSGLWLTTENNYVYGIIGNDYQRLFIKFLKIKKDSSSFENYSVYGKSNVKGNICQFKGHITITKIQEYKRMSYGTDEQYKDSAIKKECLLTAKYEFSENKKDTHSGVFSGTLQTKFYIDRNNSVRYDDIEIASDNYFNNAFVGVWKMYHSSNEKICNWGDYRVPHSNCDFDIGAGDLSVSGKYIQQGWEVPNGTVSNNKGHNTNEWRDER